jgi:hypothetical protein
LRYSKSITSICLIVLTISGLFGQTKTVSGRVLDEHLSPLPGAIIQTPDSVYQVRADKNGYYSIELPSKAKKLRAINIGMETETFKLGDYCMFNIILLDDLIVEFETEKEHLRSYRKRQRERKKIYNKAIRLGILSTNQPCG